MIPEQGEQDKDGAQGTFMVMRQLHGQAGKSIHALGSGSVGSMARDGLGLSYSPAPLQDSPGRAKEQGLSLNGLLGPWVGVPGEASQGH